MLLTGLLVLASLASEGDSDSDSDSSTTQQPADDAPERRPFERLTFGGARLSHNQVYLWDVRATGTDGNGQELDPLRAIYLAYEVGGVLRGGLAVHDALGFGVDVSLSFVPGIFGGPGPPLGVGGCLTGHVAIGNDGTGASSSPVGVVLGGGVRGDALWLTGVRTPNRIDPVVVGASPMALAEVVVSVAGFVVGLRAEYRSKVRFRRQDSGGSTDLRVERYGGGIVFGGAF